MDNQYLIVIGGPTASGKTKVAIEIANHFGTSIISADSRQFYREMNIGTAKPDKKELAAAPHHFINSLSIFDDYNVGEFEKDTIHLLSKLFSQKNKIVMAGGSGLFIKAVCEGLDEFPNVPVTVKQKLAEEFVKKGLTFLQEELREKDPVYYEEVDLNNHHRLLRALSVCRVSGQPFSSFRTKNKFIRSFTPIYILLNWEREQLYDRINRRVDEMMKMGQLEEAKKLFPHKHLTALQTVGYQELFDYIAGKQSIEEAVRLIKQNTRRYAKRQLTWFRRDDHWKKFHPTKTSLIVEYIENKME